ncbi:MAG: hypothetical protein F4Y95_09515 [Chloroflexi bacterium]|nr:hypothetical protein [Chloroflexota bacterium]
MLRVLLLLLGLGLAAIFSAACVDEIPTATQESRALETPEESTPHPDQAQQAAEEATAPDDGSEDDQPIRTDIYSYRSVRRFADRMLEVLAAERVWCDEQVEVGALRAMLDDHDKEHIWRSLLVPAAGEDLRAVRIIAEATAQVRGIPMQELPPVFLISRTSLRHHACLFEEIWEDPTDEDRDWTVGRPASRLAILLGQDVEDYSDLEQSWLSATLAWGWYGEIPDADELEPGADGVGEVIIVSRPSMPAVFVDVISHELVHFLQDQWTGWRLHDWYRDVETTDQLQALRWVVEGDASLNELYLLNAPLSNLLADFEWGPERNAELALWYRAYHALTPQDSENLFAAYDQGRSVLAALREDRGQEAIDALLLDPPESTEQLLHPEKLRLDEQPVELVDLERLRTEIFPEADWSEPIVDRMGEQWLNTLILTTTRFTTLARAVATGWGSDQMALWQSQDGSAEVVTWQVVFDHDAHHREAVNGLRGWFYSHSALEALPDDDDPANLHRWDGPSGAARLVIRPHSVWVVAADSPALADRVAEGIRSRTWTNYWSPDS